MKTLKSLNNTLSRQFSSYKTPAGHLKPPDFSIVNKNLQKFHAELVKQNPPEKNLLMSPACLLLAFATLTDGLDGIRCRECLQLFGFDKQNILNEQ